MLLRDESRLHDVPCGSSFRSVKLVLVIFGAMLVVVMPLAYASPVDPTWLPGFWDDSDFDDVILFLTSDLPLLDIVDCTIVGALHAVSLSQFEHVPFVRASHLNVVGPPRAPPSR
jgi:hypothetical protein